MAPHVRRLAPLLILCFAQSAIAQPAAATAVSKSLAVQDALRRGRDLIQNGQAIEAVTLLEEQLPYMNGNMTFLSLLREAYGESIKKLQLEHKQDKAEELQKRMQILERGPMSPSAVRGATADDDPLQQMPRRGGAATMGSLAAAEKAFAERRFREANDLFTRAFAESPAVAKSHAAEWGYCKLFVVHDRLTREDATLEPAALSELESDVAAALNLASSDVKLVSFGKQVLEDVRRRKSTAIVVSIEIKHLERGTDGWLRAETPNFRLYHAQSRDRAEQIVRAAENARAAAILKWAGESRGSWNPVCDVFLHANAADYARATGKGEKSPGHATYQLQGSTVVRRRLDLRADEPNLLTNIVPHETTHLVLGELFGDAPPPRWADEGIAVLAEPRSQLERYTRTLHRCRAQGELVHLAQLMNLSDYPDAAGITAFYVESVSIVDFLVAERDPKTLVHFLREAQRGNLDAALQKHYQCSTVAELEARWLRKLFPSEVTRASSAP